MRPKLISITRRYFRFSSSSSSISIYSSSNSIFQSRNHASSSSAPLFKNTSSGNSISSEYNKDVFNSKPLSSSPPFNSRNDESPNLFPSYSISILNRLIRAQPIINGSDIEWDEDGGPMTDFLTRFSWIMKDVLFEAYPDCDNETISAMLLIIISELEKGGLEEMLDSPFGHMSSQNFDYNLFDIIFESTFVAFEDMVKEMKFFRADPSSRHVGGVRRGMEEFEEATTLRETILEEDEEEATRTKAAAVETVEKNEEEEKKIKYDIYGIDLSDPKFDEIIDRIYEADKLITDGKPNKMNGKCKMVHDKILSLNTDQEDLLYSLLTEWTEIHRPNRFDYLTLLDNIKQRNLGLYFKMAEHVLDEDSFQAISRDYLKLMQAHTKDNRLDDAERILRKMTDKGGIQPDILTSTILVQMYNKTNNVERAKAAFDIMSRGLPPDIRIKKPMRMTVLNPTQWMATKMPIFDPMHVEAHGQAAGDPEQARRNIDNMKRFGYRRQAGDPEQARRTIDNMIRMGYRPDDRCTSSMLAAYENKNRLDIALNLVLQLGKRGEVTLTFVY